MKKDFDAAKIFIMGLLLAGNIFFINRLVEKLDRTAIKVNDLKFEVVQNTVEIKSDIAGVKTEVKRLNDILRDIQSAQKGKADVEDAAYCREEPVLPLRASPI